ncbi:nuclear transport factor 2 family protein [Geodermatophilus sp. DSM 44513]|uniref:nuclear transport factor 2 family protein n=1 Tax=Geodermatophilus sp. DSM 44513 TaxID=1528104 RepID=UPI0012735439|nr:nuclear transport factor 2 family protein [Geodermatophilus sp. DSM 44513]WNV73736.1 nuclear transport factor 2 family protein [Geodermatophilus sp. DSM 44513]
MDVDAALRCFAEDGTQEMPFAPPGFPDRLDGMAALRRQYGGLPEAYADMRFDVSAVRPMADPEWVLLEYRGRITQRDSSRYDNGYAGLFHVVDGAIVLFREYFDPLVLQRAFGGDRLAAAFTLPTTDPPATDPPATDPPATDPPGGDR